MSSKKKSFGILILLILLFLGVAGLSWSYFMNKKSEWDAKDKQNISSFDDISPVMSTPVEDNETSSAATTSSSAAALGEAGTIQELSIKPLLGRRGVGNPDAPVKIQEFFSLTCNHCATFHNDVYPAIKQKLIDSGQVYFVYEEFPLNGPALYGSMIARCLPEERYEGFLDLLLKNQEKWAFGGDFKSALKQNAMLAGMAEDEFEACFNNEELQKQIANNIKEASDVWKISSTPSFVFNDGARILRGSQPYENFEAVVKELMKN